MLDHVRELPRGVPSNEHDRALARGFVAIVVQKKKIKAVPAPGLETRAGSCLFVDQYGKISMIAAPVAATQCTRCSGAARRAV